MSGLEFIGCSENRVISVDQFQFENSGFVGNGIIPGTVLSIEESTAKLDRVLFLSQNSEFLAAIVCVINSNLTVSHSTFKSNTGAVLTFGNTNNMNLGCSELISNQNGYYGRTIIEHTKFINNTGSILRASHTEVSISYNEFLSNVAYGWYLLNFDGVLTSIDHSKFINNTGLSVLRVANTDMITLHLNEFINNIITRVAQQNTTAEILMDTYSIAVVYIRPYTTAENLTGNIFTNNSAAYEIFISSVCRPGLIVFLWAVLLVFHALITGVES